MAWWKASLPSLASAQAWAAIDQLGHEYVRADPGRTIDQARADAFVDLLLGSAQVSTTVELVVPTFSAEPQHQLSRAPATGLIGPRTPAAPHALSPTPIPADAAPAAGGTHLPTPADAAPAAGGTHLPTPANAAPAATGANAHK